MDTYEFWYATPEAAREAADAQSRHDHIQYEVIPTEDTNGVTRYTYRPV